MTRIRMRMSYDHLFCFDFIIIFLPLFYNITVSNVIIFSLNFIDKINILILIENVVVIVGRVHNHLTIIYQRCHLAFGITHWARYTSSISFQHITRHSTPILRFVRWWKKKRSRQDSDGGKFIYHPFGSQDNADGSIEI